MSGYLEHRILSVVLCKCKGFLAREGRNKELDPAHLSSIHSN